MSKAFTAVLKDFGYPVDTAYVKAKIESAREGKEPKDIISMFVSRWLQNGMD